jgi:hypothetical protein
MEVIKKMNSKSSKSELYARYDEKKNRNNLSALITFIILTILFLTPLKTSAQFTSGTGIDGDPYIISTAAQLAELANLVNYGSNENYKTAHYKLANNLDLSDYGENYNDGKGWMPIGNDGFGQFQGVFDGDGHEISGLYMRITTSGPTVGGLKFGLFGFIAGNCTIKNLGIIDVDFYSNPDGSFAETSCIAGGVVGLSGMGNSVIENCYATGSINVFTSQYAFVGGIVGSYEGAPPISNCWAEMNINVEEQSGESYYNAVGGIAGYVYGYGNSSITDCHYKGSITVKTSLRVSAGGIVGNYYNGSTSHCWADVTMEVECTSSNNYAQGGGIAGETNSNSNVEYCY